MKFTPLLMSGAYTIDPEPFTDERGWFARIYCQQEFSQIGHHKDWVQLNHSITNMKGTVRGMHYQVKPFAEIKMVKCISGAVYDVIIDLRKESPTYLQWQGVELSAINKRMMYIPEGFAHGFQTLTKDCGLIYFHSALYAPNAEAGLLYNDPKLQISWPLPVTQVSPRDKSHPLLENTFKD